MSLEYLVKHLDLDDAVKLAELEEKHGIKLRSTGRGYEFTYPNGDTSRYLADDIEITEEIRKIHSSLIPHPSSLKPEPVQAALADIGNEVSAAERDMRHMAIQDKGWNLKISGNGYAYRLTGEGGELIYCTVYHPWQIDAIKEAEEAQKTLEEIKVPKDSDTQETPDSRLQTPDSKETPDYTSDLTDAELEKYNELIGKGWTLKVLDANEVPNFMLVREYEDEGRIGTSAYNLLKSAVSSANGLDAAYQIIHAIKKAATVDRFYTVIEEYDLQPVIDGDTTKRFWMVENVEREVLQSLDDRANHLNLHRTYTTSLAVSPSPHLPVSPSPALVSQILISKIVMDERLRIRPTDDTVVEDYKGKILEGARFPPVKLFYFDGKHYLTRGWHRIEARQRAKDVRTFDTTLELVDCEVVEADYRAALLDAIGSNGTHGLRRSNDDKRRAVTRLLEDEEWSKRTDEWLAKAACVSATFIANMREELGINPTKRVTQSGREINVEKIGSKTKRKEVTETNAVTKTNLQIAEAMSDTAEETLSQTSITSLPLTGDEPLLKQEASALSEIVSQHIDGMLQATLISEHNFTVEVVDEAIRLNLIERDSYGRCWYIHKQDVVSLIKATGPKTFVELEDAGIKRVTILEAKSEGLIKQDESGKFYIPETPTAEVETKHEPLTATVEEIVESKKVEVIPESQIEVLPPVEDNPAWDNAEVVISMLVRPMKDGKRVVIFTVGETNQLPNTEIGNLEDINCLPTRLAVMVDSFKRDLLAKSKPKSQKKAVTKATTKTATKTATKATTKKATPKTTTNPTSKRNGKAVKSVTKG